ncbi:uncharacterized protein LOC127867694 isoform X3 [Dreissena polymorpha]|uniref:uncharacterized protein LOC127867694 isoform X3 n=1 Tax=Dreissena polymorpha TaxID=45954 RepID=UPI0022655B0A|nr:uncharacterized protein LOC127867694 isoform X3 [Dreissena polymorpha]
MIACNVIGLLILLTHVYDTAEYLSKPRNVSSPQYKTKDERSKDYNIQLKGSDCSEIRVTYSGHKKIHANDDLTILPTISRTGRFLLDSIPNVGCDFELNSMCSWRNVQNHDDFDWVLYQSSTPTDDTGPDTDHTLRNESGKYIFTESSAPRAVFDFAWIQSPQVDAVGAVHCFQFWYHMFGTSIGTLRVYQRFPDILPGRLVWSLSGEQGAKWFHGQVPLESNQPYTVLFEGVIGKGYTGDIAVDDVSLSLGYCDPRPAAASRNDLENTTTTTTTRTTTTITLPTTTTTQTTKPNATTTTATKTPVNPDQGGNANPSQHAVGPSDCFYNSMEYMGAYRHTYTNKRCIKWEDIGRPLGTFPDVNITYAENKCRDPNGVRGHPWCYVAPDKWEFCPVPFCQECYYSDRSHQYNGHVSTAEGGGKCETWASLLAGNPSLKPEMFPDYNVSAANNYCRDPYKTGRPQCVVGAHRTNCSIPICNGPCQDRNTDVDCSLVRSFVCPGDYLSLTQCAKTCEHCNVGVLPNVAKEPPAVVCEDNPLASCSLLSSLVCQNETAAINLCPKTCDVCGKLYAISTTTYLVTMTSQQTTALMTSKTTTTNMPTSTTTLTTSSTTTTTTTTIPNTTTTTRTSTTSTTTTITTPHWLEWGPWNCTFLGNNCFQTRNRNYSSLGNEGPERNEVQSCNVNDCPVPCEDTINCAALSELNPCKTGLGPKVCPKTCGLCESGCFDLLNCSSEGAQAFFCHNEEDAIKYCRKTCRKCDRYPKPVTLNQCMDPVASPSVCYTLHKEMCICDDESIKSICEGYCDGACGGTIRRNDTNSGCHLSDQRKRRELLTRLIH